MLTKPALIALLACANFAVASPLGGLDINDCKNKKKDDPCEAILAPGVTVESVCVDVAVSQAL